MVKRLTFGLSSGLDLRAVGSSPVLPSTLGAKPQKMTETKVFMMALIPGSLPLSTPVVSQAPRAPFVPVFSTTLPAASWTRNRGVSAGHTAWCHQPEAGESPPAPVRSLDTRAGRSRPQTPSQGRRRGERGGAGRALSPSCASAPEWVWLSEPPPPLHPCPCVGKTGVTMATSSEGGGPDPAT